jgi:Skp family chaperone for outer membrane proteins
MVKRLEGDVRAVLAKIGPDGGFSFVVRRDLFLYADKDVQDLTDQVLASLRKQAKESAPKPKADKK